MYIMDSSTKKPESSSPESFKSKPSSPESNSSSTEFNPLHTNPSSPLESNPLESNPLETSSLQSASLEPSQILYELRDYICDIKPLTETQLYNIRFLSELQKIELIHLYNKIIVYLLQFLDL